MNYTPRQTDKEFLLASGDRDWWENPEDYCPKCREELELTDGGDGFYYIYCPSCGPGTVPKELESGCNVIGYPPKFSQEDDNE